ncbi:sarcosine oxidase subunit alpha family protein [Pikeienuella piscinae]|nr:sarcosine oxidase subunit alpha family protein [Pikeienuella piscinae]
MQVDRLSAGGLIDRTKPVRFRFDGATYEGFEGDTLASALLANGVRLMGRSFKYHRPRGPLTAGSEEPNALVTIGAGAWTDPNVRATVQEVFEGLEARSQNRLGSLKFDLMAVNDLFHRFFGAGFYYKTFMWPAAFWERLYEPLIRRAAGLGALSGAPDPDCYEHAATHCDLLVIGTGPAGLMAALTASRAGARVVVADEDFRMGGRLNAESGEIGGGSGASWAESAIAELADAPNVTLMRRTTVFGVYDGGVYGALERVGEHLSRPHENLPRQCFWKIVAKRSVLAAGAIERPIAFDNNDRPGVMLSGAARTWINRYAVLPGRRAVVFTCNDDGWRTARDLRAAGAEVTVVDSRPGAHRDEGFRVIRGGAVTDARGRLRVDHVSVRHAGGAVDSLSADLVAVSGGWSPSVHLTCHLGARPVWNEEIAGFVPGPNTPPGMIVAGAAKGTFSTSACFREGAEAAAAALEEIGIAARAIESPEVEDDATAITPFWMVEGASRAWLDPQNDVTVKDLKLSYLDGFRSVEHMKRYTTLGMATDQGKTANAPAIAVMAELTGKSIVETGTTVFRPPYTPVPIAAFAGRHRGAHFHPTRLTPSHDWAKAHGADFVETGLWLRAQWFRRGAEKGWRDSVDREVDTTRRAVGICDVTTLGKIDVKGPDAGAFLDRLYQNAFSTLKVGRCRYGLMLREDGIVFDDGTAARLAEDHYLVTTTTAKAVQVMRHMEFCRQCLWPELDVSMISVTEQWAQYAVAGPRARDLIGKLVDEGVDISNEAMPYMGCAPVSICGGVKARLFRLSFSGELAYEIAVPARYGHDLMEALVAAGAEWGGAAYGTEALGVMRIEKGHAAGNELDGRTTAGDLGMARLGAKKQTGFIGREMARREGLQAVDRPAMMGFRPLDPSEKLSSGAHFLDPGAEPLTQNSLGWMTSVAWSTELQSYVGIGFIRNGAVRKGERVRAWDGLRKTDIEVEIVSPHFVDPEGERLRG